MQHLKLQILWFKELKYSYIHENLFKFNMEVFMEKSSIYQKNKYLKMN